MKKLEGIKPCGVFEIFEDICSIPHGSGDMDKISAYCMDFAKKHSLKAICDSAKNVIIYKEASPGFQGCPPIILQAHLDMVCQKSSGTDFDFEKDSLSIFVDGDFIKAKNTTLGADNGIGVAMIMAILADKSLAHPPIEAVFTTDEEIGMIGAGKFDFSLLSAKRMINLDSEEENVLTVSCAGGSDFTSFLPIKKEKIKGEKIVLTIDGLKGGHSGVEIHKGRVNANILCGKVLDHLRKKFKFHTLKINGGTKSNAIPFNVTVELVTDNAEALTSEANFYFKSLKTHLLGLETDSFLSCKNCGTGEFEALEGSTTNNLIDFLQSTPNGIIAKSLEIEGLVETSLNLGVVKTNEDNIFFHFALRSNKASCLDSLEEKMSSFVLNYGCKYETFGRYEPWEFRNDSLLQKLYIKTFKETLGKKPKIEAIHAGLECAVFSANIEGLDCISIGPDIFDVHSPKEKVSISSVGRVYSLLKEILNNCLQK